MQRAQRKVRGWRRNLIDEPRPINPSGDATCTTGSAMLNARACISSPSSCWNHTPVPATPATAVNATAPTIHGHCMLFLLIGVKGSVRGVGLRSGLMREAAYASVFVPSTRQVTGAPQSTPELGFCGAVFNGTKMVPELARNEPA